MIRLEKIVPDAQRNSVVHAVRTVIGHRPGMVPDMHLRIVENVLQRTERHVDVAVIEVPDTERNDVDEKEIVNPEADHRERNVLDRVVRDVFEPMESKVRGKTQLFDRVMHLVEFPEKWNTMQQTMNIPLNEITYHEQRQELRPDRERMDLDGYDICDPDAGQ